ncbi:MAG: hypothetical protein JWM34_5089 [Ilumatobacteraceae bacterium]|nr:hypothetical protein [Ilumatobacteraceae bacterium]
MSDDNARARRSTRPTWQRLAVTTAVAATALVVGLASNGAPTAFAALETDLSGPAGSGFFGGDVLVLSNGNLVVADPSFDKAGVSSVGAVYLYDGVTHRLISTLTGSRYSDEVGIHVEEVGSSDFVVTSPYYSDGVHSAVGAVTWIDGTNGLSGVVGPSNSLVGTVAAEFLGSFAPVVLTHGSYVVNDPYWTNSAGHEVGAAMWVNGRTGATGSITPANSLIGSTDGDEVGFRVTALTNDHYVVDSPMWQTGGLGGVGAVTWQDGSTGGARTFGAVSGANSFVGTNANDSIGSGGVVALPNGNYVINSPYWERGGTISNAGAVTLRDGSHPQTSTDNQVSSTNSLAGSVADEQVGSGGITPLTSSDYVVSTPAFANGTVATGAGAVTVRQGSDAVDADGATVSTSNSVYGSTKDDSVGYGTSGRVVALTDGNAVVSSPSWDNGTVVDVGAVTPLPGVPGVHHSVTATDSLIGSHAGDLVGGAGVEALAAGAYVVDSPLWTNGAVTHAGAVTLGSAGGAVVGAITPANSIVGDQHGDSIGASGVTVLGNGDYVVASSSWHGARGAATWAGATGGATFGVVSAANSLVGSVAGDAVSAGGVTALANGNYVVSSPHWNNQAGASTWSSGASPTLGQISAANSTVGDAGDEVGSHASALPDGTYIIQSTLPNATPFAGAFTLGEVGGSRGPLLAQHTAYGTGGFNVVARSFIADGSVVLGVLARNLVILMHPDTTPPTFASAPANVVVAAAPGATSAVVTYPTPVGADDVGVPSVACLPASGTAFATGTTKVTCTARNTELQTATTSFTVTVNATAAPGGTGGGGGAGGAGTGSSAAHEYVPLPPARLADTRPGGTTVDGSFAGTGRLAAGSTMQLAVAGRGGVPADAAAVALNVTVTEAAGAGYLTVYPCGAAQPTASNLNYDEGATIPNAVVTKIGDLGQVCLHTQQAVHVVVDVNGSFPPSSTYTSINPARLLDTRPGSATIDGQDQAGGAASAGSVTVVHVAGRSGVPGDASGVVLNVTVTGPVAAGYATVYPCGEQPPTASNLNYLPGLTIPNLVVSKVGGGSVCIYAQSPTDLVVDVDGYFPATTGYVALDPARLLDTRLGAVTVDGRSAGAGPQPTGSVTIVSVAGRGGVPGAATTAVLNVTVTEPTGSGYVTVYPCGIDPPLASNLNFSAGQTIPNAVVTAVGANGSICIYNSQPTQLIADVTGYFG